MEIERKFLANTFPFQLENFECLTITQAYISTNPTIRIRKSNQDFILTIKGSGSISREEYEIAITKTQYHNLLAKIETPPLNKKRYLVPLQNNLTAEIDVYEGRLEGLVTIEVEFESISDFEYFQIPKWFGKEVSTDSRYKNTQLSKYGIPTS